MAYHAYLPVRFGDIDHAGIVYFPRFFHLYHVALEEFFRDEVKVPYDKALDEDKVGFPAVHIESDFVKPLKYGDVIDIEVAVARLGNKSFTMRYRAHNKATGELCAEAKITAACVDMDTFKPVEFPEKYRAAFSRHLVGP